MAQLISLLNENFEGVPPSTSHQFTNLTFFGRVTYFFFRGKGRLSSLFTNCSRRFPGRSLRLVQRLKLDCQKSGGDFGWKCLSDQKISRKEFEKSTWEWDERESFSREKFSDDGRRTHLRTIFVLGRARLGKWRDCVGGFGFSSLFPLSFRENVQRRSAHRNLRLWVCRWAVVIFVLFLRFGRLILCCVVLVLGCELIFFLAAFVVNNGIKTFWKGPNIAKISKVWTFEIDIL